VRFKKADVPDVEPTKEVGASVSDLEAARQTIENLIPDADRRARLLQAAKRALPRLHLAGRCEILGTSPPILIDSAHTEASALDLAEAVKRIDRAPVHLVVSISAIRNLSLLARILGEIGEPVTITRAEKSRSIAAEEIAKAFRLANPGRLIRLVAEPTEALSSAWKAVPAEGLLCVAGSVYLAGFARSQFLPRESSTIQGRP